MRILLAFPPHWAPVMPHLALPMLTAFLRSKGLDVVQRDLSIEVFDTILTRRYLEDALARLASLPSPGRSPAAAAIIARGPHLAAEVESAKAVMRDGRFFDGRTSRRAFLTLVQSLELASLPFAPFDLQFTSFTSPVPVDQSRDLLQVVGDPARNPFVEIFRKGILQEIAGDPPDIVGISIPTMDQMMAGMTLAYLIKEAGLPCHVTIGGPHVSMLREELPDTPELFDLIDSAIVFSGETALARLAETLDGGGDLARVPNLIYRENGRVHTTTVVVTEIPDLTPDFDGLPLDLYLTPTPVLPLLSSHGCYHGKCGFCNVGYGGPECFRALDPDLVVEQVRTLRERYGARHIFFSDEALTPRTLRAMSTKLAESGADVHWCGCVRFDRALDRELLETMAAGGGRMLLFGLETAAESTIERMNKETVPEVMGRILRDSTAAGLWNHTFFFFGFPGETMEAAQETVNFVYAHQDAIHSASPGAFLLERYSPVHRAPEAYGITRVVDDPDRDLSIYFDYEVSEGLDEAMADQLVTRLVDVLPEKEFGQFYVTDAYRFLHASDLWEKGRPMPLWLV